MTLLQNTELVGLPPKQQQIQGKRFEQSSLSSNLENVNFGQPASVRLVAAFIPILLVFFLAMPAGYIGSLMSAWIGLEKGGLRLAGICTTSILGIWIATTFFASLVRSLLITFLAFVCVFLGLQIGLVNLVPPHWVNQALINNQYPLQITVSTGFGLAFTLLSFLVNRFAIAITNILFININARLAVLIGLGAVLIGAQIGGGDVFNRIAEDQLLKSAVKDLSQAQAQTLPGLMTVAGITYGLLVWVGAWWTNKRRNVPWEHPDVFRNLALVLGSWRGTSFHQLDLSGVSFRGAYLANSDLRARKLYRTCFQSAKGLERARVDNRYLDLEVPKVQYLLTHTSSPELDFSRLCLRGAYLQATNLRYMNFSDTDLSGADLRDADLRDVIFAHSQVYEVDFTNANLTGICIQDWSVNDQTCFSNVVCDYIYRELDEKGKPTDRYPADRNFEPQEFESLYQELGNVAELIFKEGVNWRAFSFSLQKLDLEDNGLGLELKGFERRGDRWVVRVTHNQHVPKQEVERRLTDMYEEMKGLLAAKEQQINKLLGIASDQAEAIKEISKKPFGNSFFIVGSSITNLTGSGNIEYTEAASQVKQIINHGSDRRQVASIVRQFVQQLKQQDVATTGAAQLELIQHLLVAEAGNDPEFRGYLLKESQQILQTMAGTPLTNVIQGAIAQLNIAPP